MSQDERRQAKRSAIELVIELYEPEGRLVMTIGRVRDLSSLGFCFEGALGIKVGGLYRGRLRMEKSYMLEVPMKVAWARSKGAKNAYGMEFIGISKGELAKMEKWVKERKA